MILDAEGEIRGEVGGLEAETLAPDIVQSSAMEKKPCLQSLPSTVEEEGPAAASSEEAVIVAEPDFGDPVDAEIAQTSQISAEEGRNCPTTEAQALDDDEEDCEELEPLYRYVPPARPAPTLVLKVYDVDSDDDDTPDLLCQPASRQNTLISVPENEGKKKEKKGKGWRHADLFDQYYASNDLPKKSAMALGSKESKEGTALRGSRYSEAEKARRNAEIERELKEIEEAAGRAKQAKHSKELEARRASGVGLRQSLGASKGYATHTTTEGSGVAAGEAREEAGIREGEEPAAERVMLKIRYQEESGAVAHKMFNVKKDDPFRKLFKAFAKSREHNCSQYLFTFEDQIDADSTPASLDMEDEDMIEAKFLSKK